MKWSWEISRVQRDKPLNAGKKLCCTYRYVTLRHRLPVCRKVADFMKFKRTSSVANSGIH